MDPFNTDKENKMINTRYIVYVNDNSHKDDSVDYEIELTSIKEVVRYIHSLPSIHYCGHVDKLTLVDGEWFSGTIMRF